MGDRESKMKEYISHHSEEYGTHVMFFINNKFVKEMYFDRVKSANCYVEKWLKASKSVTATFTD